MTCQISIRRNHPARRHLIRPVEAVTALAVFQYDKPRVGDVWINGLKDPKADRASTQVIDELNAFANRRDIHIAFLVSFQT